jgi:hypothetical protein
MHFNYPKKCGRDIQTNSIKTGIIMPERIAILGGTGKEGKGLAYRWADWKLL